MRESLDNKRNAKKAALDNQSNEISPRRYKANFAKKYKFQTPNPESFTCRPFSVFWEYMGLIKHGEMLVFDTLL